jgi:Undecaprenyl-phosphate galactose phosphotransferase WbaP
LKKRKIEYQYKIENNYNPWLVSCLLLLADVIAIVLGFCTAFFIRFALIPIVGGEVEYKILSPLLWVLIIIIPGLFFIGGLYPGLGRTGLKEFREVISFVTFSFACLGFSIFIIGFGSLFSRTVFLLSWFFITSMILIFRLTLHNRGSLKRWWGAPVAIFGNRKGLEEILTHLNSSRRMAYKPVAIIPTDTSQTQFEKSELPTFEYSPQLLEDLKNQGVRTAFLSSSTVNLSRDQNTLLNELSLIFPNVIYVLGNSSLNLLDVRIVDIEGQPGIHAQYNLLNPIFQLLKRIADLLICFITLFFSILLFIGIAIAIRIDSPGPVVFIQKRMGKNGEIFDLLKFRTMVVDAESKLEDLLHGDEKIRDEYRKHHKLRNDPRLTSVGKLLRKSSLDELPQIINIIKGEMSIVGPRAYLPSELAKMGDYAYVIHRVCPGLTGWWQVMGRHEVTFEKRLQLDEYYISNFSLWMDVYIFVKSIWVVLSGSGV